MSFWSFPKIQDLFPGLMFCDAHRANTPAQPRQAEVIDAYPSGAGETNYDFVHMLQRQRPQAKVQAADRFNVKASPTQPPLFFESAGRFCNNEHFAKPFKVVQAPTEVKYSFSRPCGDIVANLIGDTSCGMQHSGTVSTRSGTGSEASYVVPRGDNACIVVPHAEQQQQRNRRVSVAASDGSDVCPGARQAQYGNDPVTIKQFQYRGQSSDAGDSACKIVPHGEKQQRNRRVSVAASDGSDLFPGTRQAQHSQQPDEEKEPVMVPSDQLSFLARARAAEYGQHVLKWKQGRRVLVLASERFSEDSFKVQTSAREPR